jgi:ABC-2 type transport system permease protein
MVTPKQSLSAPSARSNLRALLAIARKDWKQFWRYPLNAATRMFEPLVWLAPLFFLGRAFAPPGGAPQGFVAYTGAPDYMSFILVGAILHNFTGAVFWGLGYSLKLDMDSGVLESNWLAPISRVLVMVGRSLASVAITTATSAIMLALAALFYGFRPTGSTLAALLTAVPVLVGLYGFGLAFAALVLVLREANTLTDVSNFLVGLLSGTEFPVQALPGWLLPVSLAIPLTYGLDAIRGWLLGTRTLLPILVEVAIVIAFMFVLLGLGGAAFAALERRVRRTGTLGQY